MEDSEMINELVSTKALNELKQLDESISHANTEMQGFLKSIMEFVDWINKSNKSVSDMYKAHEKLNEIITEGADALERSQNAEKRKQELIKQSVIQAEKLRQEEEKTAQQKIKTRQEEEKLTALQEKSAKSRMTDAEKQAKKEAELSAEINMQAKSIQDLMTKNNALIQVRKNLDLTTKQGIEEYKKLTKAIKENEDRLKELDKEIGRYQRNVGNYGSALGGFGKKILGAFGIAGIIQTLGNAIGKIKDFVSEGMKMASAAEGITKAFNKMDHPDLLKNLRQETKGLIDDLTLMSASVKAENFGIPVEHLGKLLKFAQQRAQETGMSVDYLTESIVMGLGRKSPLILDNLGISAVRLREKTKETGDFMTAAIGIVNEELEKQGDLALTSADKATQASVKWKNAQLAVGQSTKWLGDTWNEFSIKVADGITKLFEKNKSLQEQYKEQIEKVADLEVNTTKLVRRYEELKNKTELSKDEHTELNSIMNTLRNTIPGIVPIPAIPAIVTEFDAYGNILAINTKKVYEFIEAEKAKLSYMNKDAIKQAEKDLKDYTKEYERYSKMVEKLNRGEKLTETRNSAQGVYKYTLSDEEEEEIRKQFAYYEGMMLGAQKAIDDLSGTTIENEEKAYKEQIENRNLFNEMTEQQLDEWINDQENANSKYMEMAKQIYEKRFPVDAKKGTLGALIDELKNKIEEAKQQLNELASTDIEGISAKREEIKALQEQLDAIEGKEIKQQKQQKQQKTEHYDQKIILQQIKDEMEAQKKIADNEKESYQDRISAAEDYYLKQAEYIEKQAAFQIQNENATGDQLKYIEMVKNASLLALDEDLEKKRESIWKNSIQKHLQSMREEIQVTQEEKTMAMQKELSEKDRIYLEDMQKNLGNKDKQKEIERAYQMERLNIIRDFNQKIFEEEVKLLQETVNNTDLSENEKDKIQREIRKLNMKNAKETADYEMAITKDKIDSMKTAEEKFQEFMNSNRTKAVMDIWSQALDIANSYYDNEIRRIDELSTANREMYDEKLKMLEDNNSMGLLSDEYYTSQRKELLAKQAEDEKKLADKKKEMQTKQAKWQKANSIIQATISTAHAVTSALAVAPPLGIALAAIIGALGAVQIAKIASQKIPEYMKGTGFHPGGIAKVGEGGVSEIVEEPKRGVWKTPAHATFVDLERGTKVYANIQEWLKEHTFGNVMFLPNITQRYGEGKVSTVVSVPDEVSRKYLRSIDNGIKASRANSRYAMDLERQREFYKGW